MTAIAERRRCPRATVDLGGWLVWHHTSQSIIIRNIGACGALIIAPGLDVPIADQLRIEFSLGHGRIAVDAAVRHCPRPGWIGVEFFGLPVEVAREIEDYVDTHRGTKSTARSTRATPSVTQGNRG